MHFDYSQHYIGQLSQANLMENILSCYLSDQGSLTQIIVYIEDKKPSATQKCKNKKKCKEAVNTLTKKEQKAGNFSKCIAAICDKSM